MDFAVYIDGALLRDWEKASIRLIMSSGAANLSVVIVGLPNGPESAIGKLQDSPALRLLDELSIAGSDLAGSRTTQVERVCHEHNDERYYLTDSHRRHLEQYQLAFILFFGEREVPIGLGSCSSAGVWRFSRSTGFFAALPFMYDVYRNKQTVRFALERVGPQPALGETLISGRFRAFCVESEALCRCILAQAQKWPLLVARHLALNGSVPERGEAEAPSVPPRAHRLVLAAALCLRDLAYRLRNTAAKYLMLETWNVGVIDMDVRLLLEGHALGKVRWFPKHKFGHYIADPFILRTSPDLCCLVEDFSYFGRGKISQLNGLPEARGDRLNLEVRLDKPHHMSYPFLIESKGVQYCVPETYQENRLTLHRVDGNCLTPVRDIISDHGVTDATIVNFSGRFWMFCGLESDLDQANLYIFYSDDLEGRWAPHALNPVKTDTTSARSAGEIIEWNGHLYRPAQDCSISYGCGISISRIDVLTTTQFSETVVAIIDPAAISRSCRGVHTLSFREGIVVIDGKFYLRGIVPVLVRVLRGLQRVRRVFQTAGMSRFGRWGFGSHVYRLLAFFRHFFERRRLRACQSAPKRAPSSASKRDPSREGCPDRAQVESPAGLP